MSTTEARASVTPRKHSRYELCSRHAPWFVGVSRRRALECFVEGGPAGSMRGACTGGKCRLWPGTDVFVPDVCHAEMDLDWTREEVRR